MNEPRRTCRNCGTRLAADQRDERCGPCARRRTLNDQPCTQPAAFWRRDSIRGAVGAQHFGQLLKAYRLAHDPPITQVTLAGWLGMSQVQVSRLERPSAPAPSDLRKLQRWAAVLYVPADLLWFAPAHTADVSTQPPRAVSLPTSDDDEGEDVHRRQFLKTASTGAAVVGASLLSGPAPARASAGRAIGGTDVEIVRDMTAVFRRLDNRYGGGHSRSAATVTDYLTSTVTPMLRDSTSTAAVRRDLYVAAAELHQLAGWIAYDIGNPEAGRRRLRDALKLCQNAGDDALQAEMLAGMSHHAAFSRSPGIAVDLAVAARRTARRSGLPALISEAAVMEAHGLALKGDTTGCLAALHDAERAFDRGSGSGSAAPEWLNYFDAAYLAAKFAHAFRDLDRPKEAERFARRSLEMSDGYERGRLFNTAVLAATLADQGHVEEACATGTTAVHMSHTVRSVRGGAYLADLGRRLAPHSSQANVRTLYGKMTEAGIPTPTG